MRRLIVTLLLTFSAGTLQADEKGLLDLNPEPGSGKVLLTFDRLPVEYIYVPALQSGAGSNDLGFDRGKLGPSRMVRFERFGNRILMLEPNLAFRAGSNNPSERRAVEQAFAQSVLAGFDLEASDNGRPVIDLAPLLLSDMFRVSDQVAEMEQGDFSLDPGRSAIDFNGVANMPANTLIPVILTFQGSKPGNFIKDVTPTPDSLTLTVNHQFIALPDSGYTPRTFHPRSGYFPLEFRDYAAPLDEPILRHFIYRHRLNEGETLRYYVDNGTPEPIRSALIEGAAWWAEAFEAAGFENGLTVEVLPEGANPLDVRYNVIQWVHRSTRGWSYGASIPDPRTGEIIKAHVSLGSLRVRQDKLIAEALTAPFVSPGDAADAAREMALARLRQLSAHEVGHTLGIDHNFAASFSGDKSVMDYPHPNLYLDEAGNVRLDRAYDKGISTWDKLAVRYGYQAFSKSEERQGLANIIREADEKGIAFINDQDARVPGSAHPGAHLWDNGKDVIARLSELLEIRRVGLDNFSPGVLPGGTPLSEMERKLVPVFLLHRYQLEATAKLLGGMSYDYRMRGETAPSLAPLDAATQNRALNALVALLKPGQLALPENARYLVPPAAPGYSRTRENFAGSTGTTFDHLAPARSGAELVIKEMLQPQRLARMEEQNALDPSLPGASDVIEALVGSSWESSVPEDGYLAAIRAQTNWLVLHGLMGLATGAEGTNTTASLAVTTLIELERKLGKRELRQDGQAESARRAIRLFLEHPSGHETEHPVRVPPGSPIG